MQICISSGHSTKCQGAVGILNEVEEATAVVDEVTRMLLDIGVDTAKFHDTVSTSQNENLNRIVDWHNSKVRQLDVSVHFNASEAHNAGGTEVCYLSQKELAAELSANIALAGGLKDRGAKHRTDLFVLNHTAAPCVLIEVAFCDYGPDAEAYRTYFSIICEAIAETLAAFVGAEPPAEKPEPEGVLFNALGRCSHFGGPDDMGVAADEGLAFHYAITDANQHLFLPLQPPGTTGLARRLNAKAVHYVACRWDYDVTPKEMLATDQMALVISRESGIGLPAFCADWGPHEEETGRAADLSPALMRDLDLETDDDVEVIYPWKGN